MSVQNLSVEIARDTEEIVDDLMPYRNSKVEKEIEFPIAYKANINVQKETTEEAFYTVFADSTVRMTPQPFHIDGASTPELTQIMELRDHTQTATASLRAKPVGFCEHVPVIQEAVDGFNAAGYNNIIVSLQGDYTGQSITELIDSVEDEGAEVSVRFDSKFQSAVEDPYDAFIQYDSKSQLFKPRCKIADYNTAQESERAQIKSDVERVLAEYDLLA